MTTCTAGGPAVVGGAGDGGAGDSGADDGGADNTVVEPDPFGPTGDATTDTVARVVEVEGTGKR